MTAFEIVSIFIGILALLIAQCSFDKGSAILLNLTNICALPGRQYKTPILINHSKIRHVRGNTFTPLFHLL